MYNIFNTLPEKRQTWRSAFEIEAAALKYEQQRIRAHAGDAALWERPPVTFMGVLTAPFRLFFSLMG